MHSMTSVVDLDTQAPSFDNPNQSDIPKMDGINLCKGTCAITYNSYSPLQNKGTSLVGSESGVLEGVDASQEATLEDLTSEPNNPWIVLTNMGCHGAQTKIVPIESARDVDSQPSLLPSPRLCPRCLPYRRKEDSCFKN